MDDLLDKLKADIIQAAENPDFIYHKWFIVYHLKIVEKIALELCELYKESNKVVVIAMVWLHNYGKILGGVNQDEITHVEGNKLMRKLGFKEDFSKKVLSYIQIMDSKMTLDLNEAPFGSENYFFCRWRCPFCRAVFLYFLSGKINFTFKRTDGGG